MRTAYDFDDLASFLAVYYEGMSVLREEADFYDLAMAYFRKAHSQNVVYAEVFFDPQAHTSRGLPFSTVDRGLPPGAGGGRGRARADEPPDHVLPARPERGVRARDARGVAAVQGLDRRRRARLGRARQPAGQVQGRLRPGPRRGLPADDALRRRPGRLGRAHLAVPRRDRRRADRPRRQLARGRGTRPRDRRARARPDRLPDLERLRRGRAEVARAQAHARPRDAGVASTPTTRRTSPAT